MMLKILAKIFLSKDARELGESFVNSEITTARVTPRGGLTVSAIEVRNSPEFRRLMRSSDERP